MPTKPTSQVRSAKSQADKRWAATVYDQHKSQRFPNGRPFWGYMEYTSDPAQPPGFVSELLPGDHNDPFNSSWGAPWLPTQLSTGGNNPRSYYRLDTRNNRLTWIYRAIIADDREALEGYYQAAAEICYEKSWPVAKFGEPVSFQVRSILRRPPRSPKIAEAALAGDPWILGFTEQVNEELAEILTTTRPDRLLSPEALTPEVVLQKPENLEDLIAKAIAAHEQKKADERAQKMRDGKAAKAANTGNRAA